jgi:DnaK suppressor protein
MTVHASAPRDIPELTADQVAELEASLKAAADRRERQLTELPLDHSDLVAAAHRESVVRILEEIRAAQARLAEGRFGRCGSCGTAIPVERLELRPWTTLCVACALRS